jgi:hypothetical protein
MQLAGAPQKLDPLFAWHTLVGHDQGDLIAMLF